MNNRFPREPQFWYLAFRAVVVIATRQIGNLNTWRDTPGHKPIVEKRQIA